MSVADMAAKKQAIMDQVRNELGAEGTCRPESSRGQSALTIRKDIDVRYVALMASIFLTDAGAVTSTLMGSIITASPVQKASPTDRRQGS